MNHKYKKGIGTVDRLNITGCRRIRQILYSSCQILRCSNSHSLHLPPSFLELGDEFACVLYTGIIHMSIPSTSKINDASLNSVSNVIRIINSLNVAMQSIVIRRGLYWKKKASVCQPRWVEPASYLTRRDLNQNALVEGERPHLLWRYISNLFTSHAWFVEDLPEFNRRPCQKGMLRIHVYDHSGGGEGFSTCAGNVIYLVASVHFLSWARRVVGLRRRKRRQRIAIHRGTDVRWRRAASCRRRSWGREARIAASVGRSPARPFRPPPSQPPPSRLHPHENCAISCGEPPTCSTSRKPTSRHARKGGWWICRVTWKYHEHVTIEFMMKTPKPRKKEIWIPISCKKWRNKAQGLKPSEKETSSPFIMTRIGLTWVVSCFLEHV